MKRQYTSRRDGENIRWSTFKMAEEVNDMYVGGMGRGGC
jgi:hypothetical protein